MPPRRSHKKSKAGCHRCKHRKIKCDEVHPTCGNCAKHGVSCDFESPGTPPSYTPPTFQRSSTLESSSHVSSASTPSSQNLLPLYQTPTEMIRSHQNPAASRSLELKLMHHYTALTSRTFSTSEAQNLAWQVDIPAIAYDNQYLMDAILAVSALHLRSITPNDRSLVRASHSYMASALAQYASLLNSGLSEMNSEALFSTSALIAFQASASRLFDDEQDGEYALPLAWFHSFQGVKTVVMASWQWLRNSERVFPIINGQPPLALELNANRTSFFGTLLEGVDEQIEALPERSKFETRQAYEHAVSFLNWAHRRPERSRILGFAAVVSRRFVELVSLQDPRALVIIACFFAMTKIADDIWWLQGIAKREVNGIFGLLPPEWYGKMEWPLKIASFEGETIDEETWGCELNDKEKLDRDAASVKGHIDMLVQIMDDNVPVVPPD